MTDEATPQPEQPRRRAHKHFDSGYARPDLNHSGRKQETMLKEGIAKVQGDVKRHDDHVAAEKAKSAAAARATPNGPGADIAHDGKQPAPATVNTGTVAAQPGVSQPQAEPAHIEEEMGDHEEEIVHPEGSLTYEDGTVVWPDGTMVKPDGTVLGGPGTD